MHASCNHCCRLLIDSFIHSPAICQGHPYERQSNVRAGSTDWPLHQTRLPGVKSLVYLYQACDLRKGFSVPYFSRLQNGNNTNRFYPAGLLRRLETSMSPKALKAHRAQSKHFSPFAPLPYTGWWGRCWRNRDAGDPVLCRHSSHNLAAETDK